MLEITILASGSAGNSALVRCGATRVLIDAGLSARRLTERLAACGTSPEDLSGIVLTHEHGDHTGALRVFCSKREIPIYANRMTASALQADGLSCLRNWNVFSRGVFCIGDVTLEAFSVPHDAVDPVGFLVHNASSSFGFVTDLGHATKSVCERLREVDGIFIETNYDDDMLARDTKRPWSVKQRIASQHGHLSNAAAAAVLADCATSRLKQIIIGHLSRDCNSQEVALETVKSELNGHAASIGIHCACQDQVSPRFLV